MRPVFEPLIAIAVTLLAGCGSSIDPAAQADVDSRIASLKVSSTVMEAPAPGALRPMPLAVGQWVQYKMRLSDGQQKLLTEKIVERQGDAFWYEIVQDTYQGRTIEQLLVRFRKDTDHWHLELLALRKKAANGRVIQVSGRELSLPLATNNTYRSKAGSLVFPWLPLPQQTVGVSAGTFQGCYYSRRVIHSGLRHNWMIESWRHPSVPLGGLVRRQDDHGFTDELVAFGTDGARREL